MRASALLVRLALLWCVALLPGCIDPYMPDVINDTRSFLVVDGFINSNGVTTIRLTRSYAINSPSAPPTENRATVYIEEEGGARMQLQEAPLGTYTSTSLVLNPAKRYRLSFTTQAGQQYASDYVVVKNTPAIDNVTWRGTDKGLTLYVNSHDDTNNTRYYRWQYDETWEIIPVYQPSVEYSGERIRPIVTRYPTQCWNSRRSTEILIGKTTSLSQDVVADYPLKSLPTSSPVLYRKYSMLAQQHALTKEEYEYWELLRKNTENIGTLFDPQPAQVTGNVHSLAGGDELVLGYVGVHSVSEKRIFIDRSELPNTWRVMTGYESCLPPDTIALKDVALTFSGNGNSYIPIDPVAFPSGGLRGYTGAPTDCVDCRRRGTAVRPSFWR